MRFIEQGTPAFEGFINGSDPVQVPGTRVFEDEEGDLWFEVEPGIFAYHPSGLRKDAERSYEMVGTAVSQTLGELVRQWPDGKLTKE